MLPSASRRGFQQVNIVASWRCSRWRLDQWECQCAHLILIWSCLTTTRSGVCVCVTVYTNGVWLHATHLRFICVYPAYLNSRKTLVNGRRVPKTIAIDNPTCLEVRDVCTSQGFNCYVEAKHYPRELIKDQLHGGRVRVQLKAVDGTPVLDHITTSTSTHFLHSTCRPTHFLPLATHSVLKASASYHIHCVAFH